MSNVGTAPAPTVNVAGAASATLSSPVASLAPSPSSGDQKTPTAGAEQALKAVDALKFAQYNVKNLFDTKRDTNGRGEPVPNQKEYAFKLGKLAAALRDAGEGAHIVALQEVENAQVLSDLVKRDELKSLGYDFKIIEGNDRRGIDVAFLYRKDMVDVQNVYAHNPKIPKNAKWGRDPGANLYSRPPLMIDVRMQGPGDAEAGNRELSLVVNHWKSKIGGDKWNTLRAQQAKYVSELVQKRREADPGRGVIITGDFNALPGEAPYNIIKNGGTNGGKGKWNMYDVTTAVKPSDRYTYVYRGKKQQLDHLFASDALKNAADGVKIAHINTGATKKDYSNPKTGKGSSDHDMVLANFDFSKYTHGKR